jgi:hypothetical protein
MELSSSDSEDFPAPSLEEVRRLADMSGTQL